MRANQSGSSNVERSMVKRTVWLVTAVVMAGACSSSHPAVDSTTTRRPGTVQFPASAQLAASHVARAAPSSTDVPALVAGNTQFAFDLYQQLAKGDAGNLVFSPASISNAISMLEAGARGDTLHQIDATMHFALPEAKLHDAWNALDQMLASPRHAESSIKGTPLKLEQTDAVWGQRGYPFVRAYLDLLARDYGAGLRLADFAKDAEAERVKINAYVANATHGKIKELFKPGIIDGMTRMVLVNAIWFKGDWQVPFRHRETAPAPFTRLDGSTVSVAMMHGGNAGRALFDGRDYQAVEMPYVGGASMIVFVPSSGQFGAVEHRFGAALLADFDEASQAYGADVSMPKFDFSSQFSLSGTLSGMGMTDAFGPNRADLSGIGGQPHDLFVKAVVHKATITVDEQGTTAAAATGNVVEVTAARRSITIDRPFLFAIRDAKTHTILFTGRVLDPNM